MQDGCLQKFFLVTALLCALCGCVRVEQDLVLHADGSGVLRIFYAAKEADVMRMRQTSMRMAALDPELVEDDVDWLTAFDEARVRKEWERHRSAGVTLNKVNTSLEDGWRIMRAELSFTSLQNLFDCGMIEQCHIALTRGPDGQYGFQQSIDLSDALQALPAGLDSSSLQGMASVLLGDFHAKFQVETPGPILKSNADRVEKNRRAVWEIEGSDPDALAKLQALDLRLMFDGRALAITDARMRR